MTMTATATPLHSIIDDLKHVQRKNVQNTKSRIMLANRMTHQVAVEIGYYTGLPEKERKKKWDEAEKLIKDIVSGEANGELSSFVLRSNDAIEGFKEMDKRIEKELKDLAKQLPVAEWAQQPEQRNFGLKSLGMIIGEAGDLSNYSNPGKLWKRMGTAPYHSNKQGKTLMGATWKSGREGKLTNEEWEEYGYCPKRRSMMYVIGEVLIRVPDGATPYRRRYEEKKEEARRNHPEWFPICHACKGEKINRKGEACKVCSGKGYTGLRGHRHGMLLASKLLLKNLWMEWNPDLVVHDFGWGR